MVAPSQRVFVDESSLLPSPLKDSVFEKPPVWQQSSNMNIGRETITPLFATQNFDAPSINQIVTPKPKRGALFGQ